MKARSLRSFGRAMLVVGVFMTAGSVLAVPAAADSQATGTLSQAGYYTKTHDPTKTGGEKAMETSCGVPTENPQTCADPSLVAGATPGWPREDNYVYVTRIRGEEDAVGFVGIDLSEVPFGATVKAMTMDFQIEHETDVGTVNFDPAKPSPLKLCLVTTDWAGGDAGPWDLKPAWDCGTSTPTAIGSQQTVREQDAEGNPLDRIVVNLSANLMPMAEQWAKDRPNYGIAFLSSADSPDDFQVAIRTLSSDSVPFPVLVRVVYEPPQEEPVFSDDGGGFFETSDEVSFGDSELVSEPAPSGPFTVAPTSDRRVAISNPVTPWWVWSVVPIGLGGLTILAGVMISDFELAPERVGPVAKLMERRAMSRGDSR